MGRIKKRYTTEELKNSFNYLYITDKELYAVKTSLPLDDDDDVYVFEGDDKYVNAKNTWFKAEELEEV